MDRLIVGILIGIVVPLAGSFLFFGLKNNSFIWKSMIDLAKEYPMLYVSYLKWGAILNLIPFYTFNHFLMQKAQKGIIFGTLFWVAVIIYYNYFT